MKATPHAEAIVAAAVLCMGCHSHTTRTGQSQDLFAELTTIWRDEAEAMRYLNKLSSAQLLDLCDQYGTAVDDGRESTEGWLIEIVLGILKGREELTSEFFFDMMQQQQASACWRAKAAQYACGKERFVAFQSRDIPTASKVYMKVVSDRDAPDIVRSQAWVTLGNILGRGYYLTLCKAEGREEEVDRSLRPRIRTQTLPVWRDHEERIRQFVNLSVDSAKDGSTPQIVRDRAIPRALSYVLNERGLKTPGLNRIRELTEGLQQSDQHPPREWRTLTRYLAELESGER